MQVTFWGVRGSTPGCNPNQQKVGGHTSCVSIECDDHLIIFDAGTGLTNLGEWVVGTPYRELHLFLSHGHFDHILGLPFFKPLWRSDFTIHLYSGPLCGALSLQHFLKHTFFKHPLFPVSFEKLEASMHFHQVRVGENLTPHGLPHLQLKTLPLHHPGLSVGYRLNYQGKSVSYLSDMEHTSLSPLPSLVDFCKGSHLLIYDATYTDEEYLQHVGWGHSTWQQGIKLAQEAHIHQLAFYHHSPTHTDEQMEHIEKEAKSIFPGAFVARQGLQLILPSL